MDRYKFNTQQLLYSELPSAFRRHLLAPSWPTRPEDIPVSVWRKNKREWKAAHLRILSLTKNPRMYKVFRGLMRCKRDNYQSTETPLHMGINQHYDSQKDRVAAWLVFVANLQHVPYRIGKPDKNNSVLAVRTARENHELRAMILALTKFNRFLFGTPLYGITATTMSIMLNLASPLTKSTVQQIAKNAP